MLFKNIPLKPTQAVGCVKVTRWNTNKPGGWEAYEEMITDNDKLKDIARGAINDPDIIMSKIDKELERIKYKTFGKAKEQIKSKGNKELEALQEEKKNLFRMKEMNVEFPEDKIKDIDGKIAENLLKKQRETFERELDDLRKMKCSRGRSAAIF